MNLIKKPNLLEYKKLAYEKEDHDRSGYFCRGIPSVSAFLLSIQRKPSGILPKLNEVS